MFKDMEMYLGNACAFMDAVYELEIYNVCMDM